LVEVATVLDPSEKQVFDSMVTQLRVGDPQFVRRIDRLGTPRHRLRRVAAILLWTIAPVCLAVGGWTGFFMAIAAVWYGAHLITTKDGPAGSSTGRRSLRGLTS
jgi:hypothetical protein